MGLRTRGGTCGVEKVDQNGQDESIDRRDHRRDQNVDDNVDGTKIDTGCEVCEPFSEPRLFWSAPDCSLAVTNDDHV